MSVRKKKAKTKSPGICYLVGSGPGDLGLLTLRARECVEFADVIVYDLLSNPEMLAWAKPEAELIYVGKRSRVHAMLQDDINELLVEKSLAGNRVVRLKGGDPMLFGRGGEEAGALIDAGISFEVVPGVSSAIAGPAYAGIPVTHRACSTQLTIFTGHECPAKSASSIDYAQLAHAPGTRVMLMGVKRIREVSDELLKAEMDPATPVAMVRWATTGRQRTLTGTVSDIADIVEKADFKAPAVAVFGEVVRFREKLSWFESRPLFGRRIVVTRARNREDSLGRGLRNLGADVLSMPLIRTEPPEELEEFAELVVYAHSYDWLVFTSPNGVDAFFQMFFKLYDDARSMGGTRIAAVGEGTAKRIRSHHLAVDLVPEDSVAESLVRSLVKETGSVEHLKILWVRPEVARDVIASELTEMGAIVDEAIAYRTVEETGDVTHGRRRFLGEGADVLTFTSPSTVKSFVEQGLPMPDEMLVACIGPVTSQAVRDHGFEVAIEATQHDVDGLIEAITRHFVRD